jgi:APA family basic amino acid/polyamine antiporter
MSYVAGGALPYDKIAGANLSVTAQAVFPTVLYLFFALGGGVGAIATSYLGGIAMIRYPLQQIAEDGWLPAVFKKTNKNGYPYITYLFVFIVTMLPIVTGLNIDSIVSLVMIPSMLTNIYMNLACLTLPKKFPEQWNNRSMKMPLWFYNVCCVLGAFCAGVVAYNLFTQLTAVTAGVCVAIIAALLGLSWLRLKQGAVKKEDLEAKKKAIVAEAIQAEAAED